MAQAQFSLLDHATYTNAGITANGVHQLYCSPTQGNTFSLTSMRMIIDYHSLAPNDLPGGLGLVVEGKNGGNWYPIAHQYERYYNNVQGTQRIIILQPDISLYDDGIDSIIYVGGQTICRVSRQQGRVGSDWRVKLLLDERAYGQAQAFTGTTVSIMGELYDVA